MLRRFRVSAAAAAAAVALGLSPAKADPAPIGIGIAAAATVIFGEVLQTPQPDAKRAFIIGNAGYFDFWDRENTAAMFGLEYRPNWQIWRIKPMIGVFGTSDKAVGGYIGIGYDLHVTHNIVVNVNTAANFYNAANGKHLGSFAVLRSGVELGWRFEDATRLSVAFHHMSHGKLLAKRNPGTETLTLNLAVPVENLGKLFGR